MEFVLLWLTLNLPLPLFVLLFCTVYYRGKLEGMVIGSLYGFYVFCAMLLPCLGITALIKYIV